MARRPTHIADACAAIAFLKGEEGCDALAQIFQDGANSVAIHAVNLCEVYYDFLRSDGQGAADMAHDALTSVLTVLNDGNGNFLKRVARWKVGRACEGQTLGIADAFAAAAAEEYACTLITLDHGDFDSVDQAGTIQILWIR